MGLLSSSVSITRYKVHGKLNSSVVDRVAEGLKKNKISDIDGKADEMTLSLKGSPTAFAQFLKQILGG